MAGGDEAGVRVYDVVTLFFSSSLFWREHDMSSVMKCIIPVLS